MLLKRQRVTQPAAIPVVPPAPQPVFLVEDDLEEERQTKVPRTDPDDFSPLRIGGLSDDGVPEPGYLPPVLSYTSLIKKALGPTGSPRDKGLTSKDSPSPSQKEETPTKAESEASEPVNPVQASTTSGKLDEQGPFKNTIEYFALDILLTFVDCLPSLHDLKRQLKNIAS